jgi:predicted metal-dependent HD superfamily phosphohydrolase
MTISYYNHEEASTKIAEEVLPKYNYTEDSIALVSNIILTTKIPQGAKTLEEQILCDADLDYLGRPDFYMISLRLKYEWDVLGFKPTTLREWFKIQVEFLSKHNYYTESARNLRQKMKESHLDQIREICSLYNYTP